MKLDKYFIQLNQTEYEEEILVEEEIDQNSDAELVVYNDDYNTFDHVIKCFVQILKHSYVQSEQLSLMIHFNGKAIVKTAPYKVLKPFKEALLEKGLSAVIER
ncbi:ATP-dependent Clp protease adaptor ClpS [Membranihabitans maritimus]|uniref:ATP-dependent Clp protease adaptor ClpS n=1 Tax=Membranihabitans maritimus TaxID=2904244 RepID=UPI001F29B66B|nr:ATP-dependent Clp protease adaptor ClpS [Membranihabitans maritimus]